MPVALIPSFLFYSIISGITPGPANLCSFAAAIRYGRKQALKQWRGLFLGYATVSIISALIVYFIGNVFHDYVWVLSIVGFIYIMWLAIHMITMKIGDAGEITDCNFRSGYLVQLTNVKIMIFCISALSIYVLPYTDSFLTIISLALVLPFIGPFTNLVWLLAGSLLKTEYEKHQKIWNLGMAISLALCAVSILFAK